VVPRKPLVKTSSLSSLRDGRLFLFAC
jgi:hypothetical protein